MASEVISDDELLAMELLDGVQERDPTTGQICFSYLEPGSKRERAAREALARVLRDVRRPVLVAIRFRLAALANPHPSEGRKLSFVPQHRNAHRHRRDMQIACDIAAEIAGGGNRERAIEEAIRRYGVDRATVSRAWSKNKDFARRQAGLIGPRSIK